jgi:hypothetical protein
MLFTCWKLMDPSAAARPSASEMIAVATTHLKLFTTHNAKEESYPNGTPQMAANGSHPCSEENNTFKLQILRLQEENQRLKNELSELRDK